MNTNKSAARFTDRVWARILRTLPYSIAKRIFFRIANRGNRLTGFREQFVSGHKFKLNMVPSDAMHKQIAYLGRYEPELTDIVCDIGSKGGMMVDVGANIGYFSCHWLAGCQTNQLLAIEASPSNFQLLEQNVAQLLERDKERARVLEVGCGATEGHLSFGNHWGDQDSGCGGFVNSSEAEKLQGAIRVPVTTLDKIFEHDSRTIELLKIDTEGADALVIQGAETLLKQKRIARIHFEQNYWRMEALGIGPNTAIELLEGLDYHVERSGKPSKGLENYVAWPNQ